MARLIDGKYLLTRLIGRGGMGAVYEAHDQRLDRVVAVKVTTGDLFGNQAALQRFSREARAAAKLNHANVVRVFDIGELTGGGAYMVLEFLRGVTLRREIRAKGALSVPDAMRILQEIAAGMEEAHRLGIIHRDLKPENIFLTSDTPASQPVTKVLDFGLAVIRDLNFSSPDKLTKTGSVVGTLMYMSKEQFHGETVDPRTDIYSLGIVALEAISGEVAGRGPMFPHIGGIVEERLCGVSRPPQHQRLGVVLLKALAEARDVRYTSMREFRDALIPVLQECPPIQANRRTAEHPEESTTPFATQTETRPATNLRRSAAMGGENG
jgi:serine/threonine-protein kinase